MHVRDGRRIDREHGRERIGVLAGHDLEQCVPLVVVGALVNKGERLAVPFVDRSGPFEDRADLQTVQTRVAMLSFIDLDSGDGVAMALIRQAVELAVAAIIAGAVDELASLELPIGHRSPSFFVLPKLSYHVPRIGAAGSSLLYRLAGGEADAVLGRCVSVGGGGLPAAAG